MVTMVVAMADASENERECGKRIQKQICQNYYSHDNFPMLNLEWSITSPLRNDMSPRCVEYGIHHHQV